MKVSELRVKKKNKGYVLPRQVAIYFCRKLTNSSLIEIGEKFGGKDHSTVLHSIKKVEEKILNEHSFKEIVERLQERIKA